MNYYMHRYLVSKLDDDTFDIIKEELSNFDDYYLREDLSDETVDSEYQMNFEVCDVSSQKLTDIILPIITEVNSINNWNFDFDTIEFEKRRYDQGMFYGWHGDEYNWLPDSRQFGKMRKISFILSLNKNEIDYSGGYLEFMMDKHIRFPLDNQELVVFHSDCSHRVTEVMMGTRESLVGWVVGPPFK